jgi:kumamolisin
MTRTTPIGLQLAAPSSSSAPQAIVNSKEAFGPPDLRTFYDETVTTGTGDGTGSCIAIVGESEISPDAVSAFNSQFGLPANTVTEVIKGKHPGETKNSIEIEAEIDVEWAHAVAPGATEKLFIAATGDPLADDITSAVKYNKCSVISISFGYCAPPATKLTKVLDPQFKKAAAQGQSVFVSSGDQGAAPSTATAIQSMPWA